MNRANRTRAIWHALALVAFLASPFGAAGAADDKNASPPSSTAALPPAAQRPAPAKKPAAAPLVDINSASRAQLKTLRGIGDAEADRIIAGRPYLSKADLASRNVIPTGIYLSLKNQIIALQKPGPKPKDKGAP